MAKETVNTNNKEAQEAKDELFFGKVAIKNKLVSGGQVSECLWLQEKLKKAGRPKSLGQIMLEKGYLSPEQVHTILTIQGRSIREIIPGYEFEKKLGEGGMGAVYKAREKDTGKVVAIKILPKKFSDDKELTIRFLREANLILDLDHPNIVRGLHVSEHKGMLFMVMEYVDGEPLCDFAQNVGRLSGSFILNLAIDITEALRYGMEKELLHRDIKPDNIMITEGGMAKLTDYGLARMVTDDSSITKTGFAVGTPNYISPEAARGDRDIDCRSDIYSLGATLYHLAAGRLPFDGDTEAEVMLKHLKEKPRPPKEYNPNISDSLNAVILKMLEKSPSKRYQTPADLLKDLRLIAEDKRPVLALPGGGAKRAAAPAAPAVPRTAVRASSRAPRFDRSSRRAKKSNFSDIFMLVYLAVILIIILIVAAVLKQVGLF